MKSPAFQFYPKQWLGDDNVMLMDFDARGMHVHLMCIAWQQTPPCSIPSDDAIIRKWCGDFKDDKSWERAKQQVFRAWKKRRGRWYQEGLLSQFHKQQRFIKSRSDNARIGWLKKRKNASAKHMHSIADGLHLQSSSSISNKPPFPLLKDPENCFENVWVRYPNKDGRKAAHKYFMASVKTQKDFDDITRALTNYLASERVKKGFVKNGSTWFNNWRDWVATQTATAPAKKQCIACDKMFDADSFAAHFEKCREEFNHRNSTPLPGEAGKLVSQVAGSRGV